MAVSLYRNVDLADKFFFILVDARPALRQKYSHARPILRIIAGLRLANWVMSDVACTTGVIALKRVLVHERKGTLVRCCVGYGEWAGFRRLSEG